MHLMHLPDTTEVHCAHVQIRDENHGEDLVRACDMSFWMEGSNELLDHFDPGLRSALYFNRDADAGQVPLPDTIAVLPHLRVPDMKGSTIKWLAGEKHGGFRLIVDYGMGGESDVDLTGCVLATRSYTINEPHAKIAFRLSYAGPVLEDEGIRGRLTGLINRKAFIRLIPPAQVLVVKSGKGKPAANPNQQQLEEEEHEELTPEEAAAEAARLRDVLKGMGEEDEDETEGSRDDIEAKITQLDAVAGPTGTFVQQHTGAAAA